MGQASAGRWWSVPPGKLLEDRVKAHKKRHPEQAEQADQIAAGYEKKIAEYRDRIQPEIQKLDGEREELRKKGYDKSGRSAWQAWFERDRELYKPIEGMLSEFGRELTALGGGPGAPPATAPPMPPATVLVVPPAGTTPGNGGTPPGATIRENPYRLPGVTPSAPRTGWATAEQVEAVLGKLPGEPTEAALTAVFEKVSARGKIPDDTKEEARSLLTKAQSEFRGERAKIADEIERAQRAIRVIRRHPTSVRIADVMIVRDHWMELCATLNDVVNDLESDLTNLEDE
jgi:hypothetical protein